MERTQAEVMSVLLRRLYERGLLSKYTCQGAADLVHSMIDFPGFFGEAQCLKGKGEQDAGAEDSRGNAYGAVNF